MLTSYIRKPGRPNMGLTAEATTLALSLNKAQKEGIIKAAKERNLSTSKLILTAVALYVANTAA